jgi:hypothetical protein
MAHFRAFFIGPSMFNDYSDITDRIAEPPTWFDEHGVPRYGDFEPHKVANIYAIEVAVVEVACQGCRQKFQVAFSFHVPRGLEEMVGNCISLAEAIRKGLLWYGDPPNYNHCRSGVADTCYELRVLQYWSRPAGFGKWVRDSQLEIDLPDIQMLAEYDRQFEVARIISLFPDIRSR